MALEARHRHRTDENEHAAAERDMRGVGLLGLDRRAAHVVEPQHQLGIARKRLGRRDVLDPVLEDLIDNVHRFSVRMGPPNRGSGRGRPVTQIVFLMSDMQKDLREVQGLNAFFIVPTNVKSSFAEFFMTHPPLEKRLARLAAISREMGRPVEL